MQSGLVTQLISGRARISLALDSMFQSLRLVSKNLQKVQVLTPNIGFPQPTVPTWPQLQGHSLNSFNSSHSSPILREHSPPPTSLFILSRLFSAYMISPKLQPLMHTVFLSTQSKAVIMYIMGNYLLPVFSSQVVTTSCTMPVLFIMCSPSLNTHHPPKRKGQPQSTLSTISVE